MQVIVTETAGETMSESRGIHRPDSALAPSPEIQRLGALVGRWRSEGHVVGEVPVPITVDVVIGEQTVQAIELIGEYDPTNDSFTARSYDNQGNITIMRARVDEHGVWTFTGGGDVAVVARPTSASTSGAVRSTLTVNPDGSNMTARWERCNDDASWQPWMDMIFTRMP
jgi:hypothetical protein